MKYYLPHHRLRSQQGFTIVELMVATLVFSVILIVVTAGVTSFTTRYYRGINTTTTQNTAGTVMGLISQALQFGKLNPDDVNPATPLVSGGLYHCIGDQEFVYYPGELSSSTKGLFRVPLNGSDCQTDLSTGTGLTLWNGRQDLLQPNMRVARFDLGQGDNNTWSIDLVIAYAGDAPAGGGSDLLCDVSSTTTNSCDGTDIMSPTDIATAAGSGGTTDQLRCKLQAGSQFCVVSALSTTVQSRLSTN